MMNALFCIILASYLISTTSESEVSSEDTLRPPAQQTAQDDNLTYEEHQKRYQVAIRALHSKNYVPVSENTRFQPIPFGRNRIILFPKKFLCEEEDIKAKTFTVRFHTVDEINGTTVTQTKHTTPTSVTITTPAAQQTSAVSTSRSSSTIAHTTITTTAVMKPSTTSPSITTTTLSTASDNMTINNETTFPKTNLTEETSNQVLLNSIDNEDMCGNCPPLTMSKETSLQDACSNWEAVATNFSLDMDRSDPEMIDEATPLACERQLRCADQHVFVKWYESTICDVHSTDDSSLFAYKCNGSHWTAHGFALDAVACARRKDALSKNN